MKKRKIIEIVLVSIPLLIIIVTFTIVLIKGHINLDDINFDKLGGFGGFIGGLVGTYLTLIATFYVYKTYVKQKKELKSQKQELTLQRQLISQQQFENTFFNMLNVHRELKNNLRINEEDYIFNDIRNKEILGVDVLSIISNDYKEFYKLFNSQGKFIKLSLLRKGKLYDKLFKKYIKKGDENTDSEIEYIKHFEIDEANKVDNFTSEEKWNENLSELEFHKLKIEYTFRLLFEKYQHIISHYCRNVYHILKFIRENEDQNKSSYRKYADIFQSQLDVNEQFILYYNFYHFNDNDKDFLSTINLVEHYQFLENLGLDNLIIEKHKELYPNLNLK